ncbi:MAG: ABC transporter ATP-binding protein/permease [Coriobacteriales bacterium]|jgi:ABC-type lipoprotein export system ATPase subunit/ABC-type antimicrobial peptide transport system permease subunit|nr:ABC transporter ATP-binding protein/permease [Coriobacteriales bacterium]
MLQLKDIRKSYKTADFTQVALDDVSVAFRDNEFVAVLGPSGSGKTTMLNIVGGLDQYDSGDLIIDGVSTKEYSDHDWDTYRNNRIGFVFQSYNLIPHQTILANVELALTLSGVSRAERHERALKALDQVGLSEHAHKKPSQLSGGQMQRVAIARALINDPEILLADEPTGALDSKTSLEIMALISEIAKDRLVIMVTHNPDLANEYATRIVDLHDGVIEHDSNPFVPGTADDWFSKLKAKSIRQAAMSFITAIALSFSNMMTKKGRTFMTAFAGSIGIIGIAAILALANGVNNYIYSVETNTLSEYPLSIQSSGIDLTSMLASTAGLTSSANSNSSDDSSDNSSDAQSSDDADDSSSQSSDTSDNGDGTLKETKILSNMFSHIGSNDLASLKSYLDGNPEDINSSVQSIQYNYDVTPQIFSADTSNGVRQINPDTSFSSLGIGSGSSTNSLMSASMNTNVFDQLADDPDLYQPNYDVVAGRWPSAYNECVISLPKSGQISDFLLYEMGFKDPTELDNMIKQFANNEDVTVPSGTTDVTYDQVLAKTFKLVNAADEYQYDSTYNVWTNESNNTDYMTNLVNNGVDMHIVGIVKPDPDASVASLGMGIYYTQDLTDYLIQQAANSQIVKDQMANPSVDVITGKTFTDENNSKNNSSDFNMSSLVTVDEGALTQAFSIDPSKLKMDMSNMKIDTSKLPQVDPSKLSPTLDQTGFAKLMTDLAQGYMAYAMQNPGSSMADYLATDAAKAIISQDVPDAFDTTAMQTYLQTYMTQLTSAMQTQVSAAVQTAMNSLVKNMSSAMNINAAAFKNAFKFNMDPNQLTSLITSMMSKTTASYDNNMKTLGYADLAKPYSIKLYPKDFASKDQIIKVLDDYNDNMKSSDQNDKVITYTDIVGTLMSSVTTIINMITMVLVAFVSISLVVSSIMIGIITYISVLERKKEIGILRSIGASKKDIRRVFNAETLIIGLAAGLIAILIVLIASIPVNAAVYAGFNVPNIISLPAIAAIILIAISMLLTFIAGLIPAGAAARKDPVEALRSE